MTSARRVKTYTAQSGYVYEYYFVGKRPALDEDPFAPSTEFVFDVSPDRKSIFAVSVFLPPAALASYEAQHDRNLSDPEQYAAAKLRLLLAFDEITNMVDEGRRLVVDADALEALLASVGID